MTVCSYCNQQMSGHNPADECTLKECDIKGATYKRTPYENRYITGDKHNVHRCHDCNVLIGKLHHPGCDMERCPKCGGQAISCRCDDSSNED